MTEAIPVNIYFCLDRSGSMEKIREDVVGGFNRFLADQKSKPGKCKITVVQFDSVGPFEVIHDAVKLADVPEMGELDYKPRGGTPLLDAEGRLIVLAEERAAKRAADGKKTEAVIFATFTDGLENASREWTHEALSKKKKEHEGDWAFIYLGVGHDAYSQSSQIGTRAVNTVSAARDAEGTQIVYDFYVCDVGNVRDRASRGLTTNSADVAAARRAEMDKVTTTTEP